MGDVTPLAKTAGVERLERASLLLSQASSPEEFQAVRDMAEAARVFARQVHLGTEAVNFASLVKVRSEMGLADCVDKGQAEGTIATKGKVNVRGPDIKTLDELGVDRRRLGEARELRDAYTPDEIKARATELSAVGKELSRSSLLSGARRKKRQQVDADAREIIASNDGDAGDGETWTLLAGELQERMAEIPAGSVDLIVTDPPYPREALDLWADLAKWASVVLKPQGILVGLTGQIMLPDVLERLGQHLSYGWIYCQTLPGANSRIMARHIGQCWKPWVAYSNGPWPSGAIDWHPDLLDGVKAEKAYYSWQQSEKPAGQLIDYLSPVNGMVLDPFAGTGTYGAAALRLGRRFTGIEADAGRFATATARLGSL